MLRFLRQPYPRDDADLRRRLYTSAGVGLFVALFLNVFQPFGSAGWDDPRKPWYLAGYGLVTFVCMVAASTVFPLLFKRAFDERNWTVGRDILWTLAVIVLIATGNYLYAGWTTGQSGGLLDWLLVTAAVGIIPVTVVTLLSHNRLLRKYAVDDWKVRALAPEARPSEMLTFLAENEKDSFTVTLDELLCIESADNYSEIVFTKNGEVKKTLLRGSLSRFEEQAHHPAVVRCHRSFIVNLRRVERVTGNAQGYKLHLENHPTPVPVSRKYGEIVAGYFKN